MIGAQAPVAGASWTPWAAIGGYWWLDIDDVEQLLLYLLQGGENATLGIFGRRQKKNKSNAQNKNIYIPM